ncbi:MULTISPECIES: hypothetical protein [unclassified Streptomyces]
MTGTDTELGETPEGTPRRGAPARYVLAAAPARTADGGAVVAVVPPST